MAKPILVVSDDPSQSTGLARITRDLCTLLSSMDEFRVASLGLGGTGSARFPWVQYHMTASEFGEISLPSTYEEHAKEEDGIVLVIWDCTRMLWLARPEFCEIEPTREWLTRKRKEGRVELWAYMPFDSCGPGGKFTSLVKETLLGIDRIVVPSPVALQWVVNTIGAEEAQRRGAQWMPHGLGLRTFAPTPISISTSDASDVKRIGCVMTNQVRKDLGLWGATCAGLAERLKGKVKFWLHIDTPERHWSVPAVIADFNLGEHVEVTYPPVEDSWLAEQYRKCDVTFLPSTGEGFGFPIFESLACGTPCVTGDYAGGASLMRAFGLEDWLVAPRAWRVEGVHNCVRPVYAAEDFVDRIARELNVPQTKGYGYHVQHLSWMKLGHRWKRFFKDGL